jgi:stage II sporulation protein D
MRARSIAVVLALLAIFALPSPSPNGPLATRAAAASSLPRITFVAAPGGSFLIHGVYPKLVTHCVRPVQPVLHARFTGTIEVGRDAQGMLFVIGVVSLEDYLKGIAEVPRLWPMEALKAQVVAARTYALSHMAYPDPTGAELGYQLCSTDACQVYRGLGIADGPYGGRWRKAVDATRNQVLLYGGRPADTLYFSTSKGVTLGNDQVFGSAPLPYLRPIVERDDGASPVSHWRATISLADVTTFLRKSGDWSGGTIASATLSGSNVTLSGGGTSTTIAASSFRSDVNAWAHCLHPDRYPTVNAVNGTTLPQTVPSVWFSLATSGGSVVLTGRGWGHGVGMVQWGAEGKAARGLSYQTILADYYGGLRPQVYAEPATIRVGIAVGLKSVIVSPEGPVTVSEATAPGSGPWVLTGQPALQLAASGPPPTYIQPGSLSAPTTGRSGRTISATLSLPQLSVASLVLSAGGVDTRVTRPATELAGTVTLTGTVPEITTGTYSIQAEVSDGIDIVRTPARSIHIDGLAPTASPNASPGGAALPPTGHPASPAVIIFFLLVLIALPVAAVGVLALLRRRRGRVAGP